MRFNPFTGTFDFAGLSAANVQALADQGLYDRVGSLIAYSGSEDLTSEDMVGGIDPLSEINRENGGESFSMCLSTPNFLTRLAAPYDDHSALRMDLFNHLRRDRPIAPCYVALNAGSVTRFYVRNIGGRITLDTIGSPGSLYDGSGADLNLNVPNQSDINNTWVGVGILIFGGFRVSDLPDCGGLTDLDCEPLGVAGATNILSAMIASPLSQSLTLENADGEGLLDDPDFMSLVGTAPFVVNLVNG